MERIGYLCRQVMVHTHIAMITKESIETAYCFLHQKLRVYLYSNMD